MSTQQLSNAHSSSRIHKLGTALVTNGIAISLLLGASPVQAAPMVIQDPSGNVTAIQELLLNGSSADTQGCFDVEFAHGRGADVFGGGFNYDFNGESDAFFAADAVAAVLNAESTPVNTANQNEEGFFDIPYFPVGNNAKVVRGLARLLFSKRMVASWRWVGSSSAAVQPFFDQ